MFLFIISTSTAYLSVEFYFKTPKNINKNRQNCFMTIFAIKCF
nr:MAG TPA: hypothetical protein [Caudoviricetes sp.]